MRLLLIILLLVSAPIIAQAQQAPRFFESLYDVPVMPNMAELKDMAVSFDKPHGRIAYAGAQASAALTPPQIMAFYDKTLPQMGWRIVRSEQYMREYRRNDENLRLFFVQSEGTELLQFMLFPS